MDSGAPHLPGKFWQGTPGECWLAEKGARTKGRPTLQSPTTGLMYAACRAMTSASSTLSFSAFHLAGLRIRTIVGVGVVNVAAVAVVTVVAVAADVSNVMGTRGPPPCSATAPPPPACAWLASWRSSAGGGVGGRRGL